MSLEQIIIIFIIVVLVIATICILIMVYEIIKERLEKKKQKKEIEEYDDLHFDLPYTFASKEEYAKCYKELVANKGINRPITRVQIKFFESNNKTPFLEFLNGVTSEELKEKIVKEIYNLAEQGGFINDTDQSQYLDEDIYCLVVEIEKDNELVVYYYPNEEIDTVILLNGATIKSKMDNVDAYKLARSYRDEYIKQVSEEENSKEEPKKDSAEAIKVTKINK